MKKSNKRKARKGRDGRTQHIKASISYSYW